MTTREATGFLPIGGTLNGAGRHRSSASDWAAIIGFGLVQWPWLLKSLSGGRRRDKAALLARLGLPSDALPNLGSWKADTGFLKRIIDRIEEGRPQSVVELGAGASTLVTARALQLFGGGRLTSYDQHDGFVDATRAWLGEHGMAVDLRAAPLTTPPAGWPGLWYALTDLPETIELLLIDGPHWTLHPFVRGAAEILFDRIPVGGIVMLDDAARLGERVVARRWKRKWPGFEWRLEPGIKGTLVGVRRS